MTSRSFQFASFRLDLGRLCLFGPDGHIALRPKSFDVLRHLIEHAGRVVGKDELINAVWPDVMVTEESLTLCISEVRRALGDKNQRIIRTVPRRGYLLDVPISVDDVMAVAARQVAETRASGNCAPSAGHVPQPGSLGLIGQYVAGLHDTSGIAALPRTGLVQEILQFHRFTLDLTRGCLRADGHDIKLRPKVFEVLRHLAENAGRLVPKQELHEAVWAKAVVSDDALMQCIRELRKKLGDDKHRLIKVVPRRGYLLDATLATPPQVSEDNAAARQQTAIRIAERPAITVTQFTNIGDDPDHEHFARGMTEDIIAALSRCNWLFVIARGSPCTDRSSDGRRIGSERGVDYTLEGTVRRAESRLRITVRLVDALSGVHIWADRFDGDTRDIFELQDRITENVVAVIEPRLENAELRRLKHKSIGDLDAYDLVLCAHALENEYTEESLAEAIRCSKQAMALDPSYAPAMAMAALCCAERRQQGWSTNPEEDTDEGLRHAIRALEISQHDPRVLWMGSFAVRVLGADSHRGWELAARSLELNPNSTMALANAGWAQLIMGNPVKALEFLRRAERLNPRDSKAWYTAAAVGLANFATGRYEEATQWAKRSLARRPLFASPLRTLAASLAKLGRAQEAAKVIQDLAKQDPHITVADVHWRYRQMHESVLSPWLEGLRIAGLPR
jgi:DNA-binding winged helix-turn-helix (wHTH) protein/tetratricopeptide (TPR) repeat protein